MGGPPAPSLPSAPAWPGLLTVRLCLPATATTSSGSGRSALQGPDKGICPQSTEQLTPAYCDCLSAAKLATCRERFKSKIKDAGSTKKKKRGPKKKKKKKKKKKS